MTPPARASEGRGPRPLKSDKADQRIIGELWAECQAAAPVRVKRARAKIDMPNIIVGSTTADDTMEPTTLFAVGDSCKPTKGRYLEVCVDSGCGRSVIGKAAVQPAMIKPTPQSARGHFFVGPADEKYPNLGKVTLEALNEGCRPVLANFYVAEGVSQALASVAESNDSGNMVIFDKQQSVTMRADSPEGLRIRKAIAAATQKTLIHRRGNSFYLPLWVQDWAATEPPFPRQGA